MLRFRENFTFDKEGMAINDTKDNTTIPIPASLNHEKFVVLKYYTTKHQSDPNFEKKYSYFPIVPANMNHVKELCFLEYRGIDLEKGKHCIVCTCIIITEFYKVYS